MSKMGWESAKADDEYGPPPMRQIISLCNEYTKSELSEIPLEDLDKLDSKLWDYWKKVRAVIEFRRLD